MVSILALAGSIRKDSYNQMLLDYAVAYAQEKGAQITVVDLKNLPIPVFNQDDEDASGLPENVRTLKKLFSKADGIIIASPEYNGAVTPLLKNVLDWVSRKEAPDEKILASYKGKTAALLSASPGSLGGIRGLSMLRTLLSNLGVIVLPNQVAVSDCSAVLSHEGISNENTARSVRRVVRSLIKYTESSSSS